MNEQERRDLRAIRVTMLVAGLTFAGGITYPISPTGARIAVVVVSALVVAFCALAWRGLTVGRGPRDGD